MKIMLNGEPLEIAAGTTVAMLVQRLSQETGRDPRGIAVERNREIVPKSEHAMTVLEDGDRLELVQFVGGG
ncbi:MAG TPA: sulfur carrier protein ThiS [Hyphomonas sp.]|nr:sulfur carrier protein ThiS [Hyphomonas sp.]HRK68297.1 sulfur carrier protein ThiS [Hyphomonas sp.]